MTANRLHSVDQNMWHRFHAYDSQDHIGPAKRVQNQNRYLCVWSLDLHRVRGQSIRVTLHPAMCKFVIRSMVNCHDWIRMANDGVPLSKIRAAAVDMSMNEKCTQIKNSGKSSVTIQTPSNNEYIRTYLFSVNLFRWRLFLLNNHRFNASHFVWMLNFNDATLIFQNKVIMFLKEN